MEQIKQYTGRAYLYIEDGEVVANKNLMPQPVDYWKDDVGKWYLAMEEWETQHIKVENIRYEYVTDTWQYYDKPNWSATKFWHIIVEGKENLDGQPCHIENGKVVKLLT